MAGAVRSGGSGGCGRASTTSTSGLPACNGAGRWGTVSVFLAAADVGGVAHPVAGGGALPGDGDVDVDAGHAGQDGGGEFGGELKQGGGAGWSGADADLAEVLFRQGRSAGRGVRRAAATERCPGLRWWRGPGGWRPGRVPPAKTSQADGPPRIMPPAGPRAQGWTGKCKSSDCQCQAQVGGPSGRAEPVTRHGSTRHLSGGRGRRVDRRIRRHGTDHRGLCHPACPLINPNDEATVRSRRVAVPGHRLTIKAQECLRTLRSETKGKAAACPDPGHPLRGAGSLTVFSQTDRTVPDYGVRVGRSAGR